MNYPPIRTLILVSLLSLLSQASSCYADNLLDVLNGGTITSGPNLVPDFANDVGTSGGSNLSGTTGKYTYVGSSNTITPLSGETSSGGTGLGQGALLSGSGQMVLSNSGAQGYLDLGSNWSDLLITRTFTSYLSNTSSSFGPGGPLFSSAYWTDDVSPGTTDYLEDLGASPINFGLSTTFSTGKTHQWLQSDLYTSFMNGGVRPDGEFLVYTLNDYSSFSSTTTAGRMDGLAIVGRSVPEPAPVLLLISGLAVGLLTCLAGRRAKEISDA